MEAQLHYNLEKTISSITNLAEGFKHNLVGNIYFVYLIYKMLTGGHYNTKIIEMDLAMSSESSEIMIRSC